MYAIFDYINVFFNKKHETIHQRSIFYGFIILFRFLVCLFFYRDVLVYFRCFVSFCWQILALTPFHSKICSPVRSKKLFSKGYYYPQFCFKYYHFPLIAYCSCFFILFMFSELHVFLSHHECQGWVSQQSRRGCCGEPPSSLLSVVVERMEPMNSINNDGQMGRGKRGAANWHKRTKEICSAPSPIPRVRVSLFRVVSKIFPPLGPTSRRTHVLRIINTNQISHMAPQTNVCTYHA